MSRAGHALRSPGAAAALALALGLAQILSFAHLASHSHLLREGRVAHCDSHPEPSIPADTAPQTEECQVLAMLHQGQAVHALTPYTAPQPLLLSELALPERADPVWRHLFLLAPSHSPPS